MRKQVLLWAAFGLLSVPTIAPAQTITTGEISGTVTDPTGAAVANSKIMLRNDATGETQTATSGNVGEFRFPLLRPGAYTVDITSPGFQETTQKATVNLGQVTNVNVQLGLAAANANGERDGSGAVVAKRQREPGDDV